MHIGKPIENVKSIHQVRQAVTELGADAAHKRQGPYVSPAQMFVRQARRRLFQFKVGDSQGNRLTGGMALMRILILRRLLNRHVLQDDERSVAVLIPPSFGGVAVNMALALDKRISVNLNYTVSSETLNYCISKAKARRVLTSRKVMEKFDFKFDVEVVYLEDLRDKLRTSDKIAGLLGAFLCPAMWLEYQLDLRKTDPDETLTLIFTSGSTGQPKGVALTHRNISSNVEAIDQVVHLKAKDVVIGILPFFHSFGYTVTMWGGMGLDVGAAYHFSPLEPRQVGKLCQTFNGTCLLATPTFLRSYTRKCSKEEFQSLDVVVAGAEKLPKDLCDAFEKEFSVRPVEGYGTTELSPLVSVNVPPSRSITKYQPDCKEGTVGRTIPNVAAKITDLDSEEELDANQSGMLWIKGPNVMKGYLDLPDKTAEVLQDGWYKTGDVAEIDDEGFIKITGRISRFSKIGGEMVPHVVIEDTLSGLLNGQEQETQSIAVTSVSDAKRGERLVVLHTKLDKSPDELRKGLSEAGLPNLFVPSSRDFYEVESLPLLGSGKLDLRSLQKLAKDVAEAPSE